MSFELTGTLHVLQPEQQIRTLRKREFVLRYADNPDYPQLIKFEAVNDRISQLDGLNPGDELTVSFRIKGREWTNPQGVVQYFTSLEAWRVQRGAASAAPRNARPAPAAQPAAQPPPPPFAEGDDLPF